MDSDSNLSVRREGKLVHCYASYNWREGEHKEKDEYNNRQRTLVIREVPDQNARGGVAFDHS